MQTVLRLSVSWQAANSTPFLQVMYSDLMESARNRCTLGERLGRPFVKQAAFVLWAITSHPDVLTEEAIDVILDTIQCLVSVNPVFETVGDNSGFNIFGTIASLASALAMPYHNIPTASLKMLALRLTALIPSLVQALSRTLAPVDSVVLHNDRCTHAAALPLCRSTLSVDRRSGEDVPQLWLSRGVATSALLSDGPIRRDSKYDIYALQLASDPFAGLPALVEAISSVRGAGLFEVVPNSLGVAAGLASASVQLPLQGIPVTFLNMSGTSTTASTLCVGLPYNADQSYVSLGQPDATLTSAASCAASPDAPVQVTLPLVALAVDEKSIGTIQIDRDATLSQNPDVSARVNLQMHDKVQGYSNYTHEWLIIRNGVELSPEEQGSILVGGSIAGTSSAAVALDISVLQPGTYEFVVTTTSTLDQGDVETTRQRVSVQPPPDISNTNFLLVSNTPGTLSGRDRISLSTENANFGELCSALSPTCPLEYLFYMSVESADGSSGSEVDVS